MSPTMESNLLQIQALQIITSEILIVITKLDGTACVGVF